ncbi:MAG: TVP38/TMEM64 family protein [Anaerolineales bacterium]|nr:TVP38/TMEM64 family protein [Anaerolineales bacterium]
MWLGLIGLCAVFFSARWWPTWWQIVADRAALQALMAQLGWGGPLALVLINVAQIIVAPVPGYMVQAVAGYLYGPWWGGLWGAIGLLCGAMLAMWLARRFGRPLAQRMVGAQRLDEWETTTHSTSVFVWTIILVAPTGDLPYFLAGLSHVSFLQIFLLTFLIRVPTVFFVTSAASGVWYLSGWQLVIVFVLLGALLYFFLRYRDRIIAMLDRRVQRRLPNEDPL